MEFYRSEYIAKLDEVEQRRASWLGPNHPSVSYLTCSLYDTCRDRRGDLGLWGDLLLHMAVPSLHKDFFRRLGRTGWVWLPSLSENDPMPLSKWLKDHYLYYYFNHGCSPRELSSKLRNLPMIAGAGQRTRRKKMTTASATFLRRTATTTMTAV